MRRLDHEFQRSGARSKVAATAELLHLSPGGAGAAAMDSFLSRYRALLAAAGAENVGPAAQADVLQRATVGHAVLGHVVAAWRHAGDQDPKVLLEKLEDAVAEGRPIVGQSRGGARAWAAIDAASWQQEAIPLGERDGGPPTDRMVGSTGGVETVGGLGSVGGCGRSNQA